MKIYNSLTKEKSEFLPGKLNLYVCGMTVYDYCHIGHGRMMVTFDVIVRVMRALGFDVTYVRNITDIDDKIIKRAHENGESAEALASRFIEIMHDDELALGVNLPDIEPRATEYIPHMVEMIETLIEKGFAYVTDHGDVCYDVSAFSGYGKLSRRSLDDLQAGARVEINEGKRSPLDFVLWKLAKPGEPSWKSPWGEGRPGWHIECSVMSSDVLGLPIDIHGGGIDLKFPHHENEIAQSEAACDCAFVNTWMHVGHVQVDDEKMSKSLGNFLTLRDAMAQFQPEVLRYFMIAGHYRSPINFSKENMDNAKAGLTRLYSAVRGLALVEVQGESAYTRDFFTALADDVNTPQAFAVLFDMVKEVNRLRDGNAVDSAAQLASELVRLASVFGLLTADPEVFLQAGMDTVAIDALVAQRNQARADKAWALADKIRDELVALGIVIEDGAGGTRWRKI